MVEPETDADRFWRCALRVYLPEEARRRFLRFQDAKGGDVPLALFCLWCGAERLCLSEKATRAAIAFSADWRMHRVEPLRILRAAWKDAPGPLPHALSEQARQRVARAEQAIERLQMDHLVTLRSGNEGGAEAPRANLDLYCRLAGVRADEEDLAGLVTLSA